jgi:Glucodextranase, domain B
MKFRKHVAAIGAAALLVTVGASTAWADDVENNAQAAGNDTFTLGNSTTIAYWIKATNQDGQPNTGSPVCNAADGSKATLTIVTPAGVTATPGSLEFTLCGGPSSNTQNVVFTATDTGTFAISATVADSGAGTYDKSGAAFSLHVNPAAVTDTTDPADALITINDGDMWTNAGSGAVSVDVSATDNVGVASYRLAESQSGLDSATVQAVSPGETAFSRDNVAFTLTGGEAASKAVWLRVCDAAGNCSDASDTIGWDYTAPAAPTATVAPDPNAAGWNNTQPVTVSYAANGDNLSGISSCSGDDVFTAETPVAGEPATGTCTDNAGNTSAETSKTVKIDLTAPAAPTATVAPVPNAAGWNNTQPVTVSYTDNGDSLSGVESCSDNDVFTDETTAAGVAATGTCTDIAGNTSAGTSTTVKIDLTNPNVDITSPATGLTTIAASIPVSGTASDTPSGLNSVTVNGTATTGLANWATTSNVVLACGENTITATATDNADRTGTDTITVTRLCFSLQYLRPIDQSTTSPIVNTGKYGRVLPVKVLLSLNGQNQRADDLTAYGLTVQMGVNGATCESGAAADAVEEFADAGASNGNTNLFRWDPAGMQWIYNLDTKAPPGMTMTINRCYRLDVYVSDGPNKVKVSTTPYALFKPTK